MHHARPRRRLYVRPRFYLLLILCIVLGFGISCISAQIRFLDACRRVEVLEIEKQQRSAYVESLTRQLDIVGTDACILQVARDELNMILPGEIRYIAD